MAHKSVSLIKVHAPADTTAALIYNKHSVGCSERTNAPKESLTLALRWQLSKGPPERKKKVFFKTKTTRHVRPQESLSLVSRNANKDKMQSGQKAKTGQMHRGCLI